MLFCRSYLLDDNIESLFAPVLSMLNTIFSIIYHLVVRVM